jgi:hypothetical protein
MDSHAHPKWMNITLKLAAIYNVAFGLITLFAPFWIFDWAGAQRPNYPELWQCIGMIVGVYGVGYWIASYNPLKHWPIVFVGWLGKIFGPIGFAQAVATGIFPIKFGWTIVFNDLIWWWPFTVIVFTALKKVTQPDFAAPQISDLEKINEWTQKSNQKTQIVFFMRHAGCTFCREALEQLHQINSKFRQASAEIHLVHMGPAEGSDFAKWVRRYPEASEWNLTSDPGRSLYVRMGLSRGNFRQIFSPQNFLRALRVGVFGLKGVGALEGDGFMMPGVFVWKNGELIFSWKASIAAEQFPFEKILEKVSAN